MFVVVFQNDEEEDVKMESSSSESDDADEEQGRDEREEDKGRNIASRCINKQQKFYSTFSFDYSDTESLREDLADLSTEISIKQKLIEELENSQKRLNNMKLHYEEKLSLLERKIKETETERDRVLDTIQEHDKEAADQSQKVKANYEKKINDFKDELKKLQSAKKEHNRLMRTKVSAVVRDKFPPLLTREFSFFDVIILM